MCSLTTFQNPPPLGYVTLREQNSDLIAVDAHQVEKTLVSQDLKYPQVHITTDPRKPVVAKESARSAFLEHDETLQKRLLRSWYEHGMTGILEVLARSEDKKGTWLSKLACGLLGVVRWSTALHGSLFPHLLMSSGDLITEYSTNPAWRDGLVRCFAWHPHTTKFALALQDDSIKVYTASKPDIVPTLKHKLQKGVADLAWKNNSASVLAVACESCILIWHVDPTSLATRPSTSSVQVLSQSGHLPVISLAWSPRDGVLMSASPTQTAIMAWDVAMETCIPIRRAKGGGISLLRWSPEGSRLLTGCPGALIRVWETRCWTSEAWTKLPDRCTSACWNPNGRTLLFTTGAEPTVFALTFTDSLDQEKPVVGGAKDAVPVIDLTEVIMDTPDGPVRIGGLVQSMVWDPTGERLAIQFKGASNDLIALFRTKVHPILEIMPCGFVRGMPGEIPNIISFQLKFEHGALLTVAWSSGRISYVPLNFMPQKDVEDIYLQQNVSFNGQPNRMLYSPR